MNTQFVFDEIKEVKGANDIWNLAEKVFKQHIEWGSGVADSFPMLEQCSLQNLDEIIQNLSEPFTLETYKEYTDGEEFDTIFEHYNMDTKQKEVFFEAYRNQLLKHVLYEYYCYWKSNQEE